VLYCRQKLLRDYHSRRKSCTNCRRAKTRCNEVTPQCARCETKRLGCVYEDVHSKDSSLQVQEFKVANSRRDAAIGPSGSTTHQVALPSHGWQASTTESRDLSCEGNNNLNTRTSPVTTLYNPLIESGLGGSDVDFQLNSSTLSHDFSLDPFPHYEVDFPWHSQHQINDGYFGADGLVDHTVQDIYNSSQQLTQSCRAQGPSQIASQIRYD
jgi:hypothetical protein